MGYFWEVDEFLGAHAGLVLAEIELQAPDQPFARPPWLGKEVTDDPRYHNSSLSKPNGALLIQQESEPAFLPGETGKELDAGRMMDSSSAVEAEERRLGRLRRFRPARGEPGALLAPAHRDHPRPRARPPRTFGARDAENQERFVQLLLPQNRRRELSLWRAARLVGRSGHRRTARPGP